MPDAAFCNWFAGFSDGEACFRVSRYKRVHAPTRPYGDHYSYRLAFTIALRRDDRAILDEISTLLGVGSVRDYHHPRESNTEPYSVLTVNSREDVAKLVKLFTKYPLRAKKKHDFEVWKRAFLVWEGMQKGGGDTIWQANAARRTELSILHDELKAVRAAR